MTLAYCQPANHCLLLLMTDSYFLRVRLIAESGHCWMPDCSACRRNFNRSINGIHLQVCSFYMAMSEYTNIMFTQLTWCSYPLLFFNSLTHMSTTLCEVLWWNHSRSVTKNLTPYRFNSAGWGLDGQNGEIHSFPTMYNTWGCLLGRNGSKQWFSPKKWSKNSFFEYHDSGSSNFGLGWDPKF